MPPPTSHLLTDPPIFRSQFSITIVSSMVLSVIVALVLSPALAAMLLKPPSEEHHDSTLLDRALGRFGTRFNNWFEDRKSTRLNSSNPSISSAVFCFKKKI